MRVNNPPYSPTPGESPRISPRPSPAHSASPRPLGVLLVDDHPLISEGLQGLLSLQSDLVVMGTAGTGAEALKALLAYKHLVLLDWFLPDTTGPELIPQILAQTPQTKILVYTGQPDEAVGGSLTGRLRPDEWSIPTRSLGRIHVPDRKDNKSQGGGRP